MYGDGFCFFLQVHNFQEAVDVINLGLQNRVMAPTMMNETSSRSHTVLTVRLAQVQHVGVSDAGVDSSVGSGVCTIFCGLTAGCFFS